MSDTCKIPRRLLPRVLWRVLPYTILVLLGIWIYASYTVASTVSSELEKALNREAVKTAEATGARLASTVDALIGLARNDLVINGLIDMEDRANYLPRFFRSLHLPGASSARVTLTDYRGRNVTSNAEGTHYEDAAWLFRALTGEQIIEFGPLGMLVAIPVTRLGQTDGLIVMEQTPEELADSLKIPSVSHAVEIWAYDEFPLYISNDAKMAGNHPHAESDQVKWVFAKADVPGFPALTLVIEEREEIALAPAKRLDRLMLVALLLSIAAITGGIVATAYFTTNPLIRFIDTIKKIGHVEDLSHRIEPFGSAEFHALTSSLNHMLESLEKTTTSRDYFDTILNSLGEILLVTDLDGRVRMANQAATEITGWPIEELEAQTIDDILRSEGIARDATEVGSRGADDPAQSEGHLTIKNGSEIPVQISVARLVETDSAPVRWVYVLSDITERKQAERQLEALAQFDTLTGLANRSRFRQRLHDALAQAKRSGQRVALLLLDLDRFKEINDTHGHPTGDALLQEVAKRLNQATRETDTVARLGGDEFAIIGTNFQSLEGISSLATKLIDAIAPPFLLDGKEIRTSTSIGISICPPEQADPDIMFIHADFALYQAKEACRGTWRFFDEKMNAQRIAHKALELDLERAVAENQLKLFYQPKVGAITGEFTGVEALIRWFHPEKGLIPPSDFIPVAEATGKIIELSKWVLNTACAQHVAWRDSGLPEIPIAVNLSTVQFKDGTLIDTVKKITSSHGVAPKYLELEITESMIVHNVDDVERQLACLHDLGYKIYIDDFGTGYSSLAYLRKFPIDALKIDRSFVRNMTENSDDASITNAIIALASSLGMDAIAEGVETHEQLALLRRQGCTEIQGYFFKPPVEADELAEWLQSRGHSKASLKAIDRERVFR